MKFKEYGTAAALGSAITFAAGFYFDFIDVEMKSQEQAASRIRDAQEKLDSPTISDQLSGIDDFQRIAEDYPDHALKRAIDRIAVFLQLRTDVRKDPTCGSPDTTRLATSALKAIGELNDASVGIIDLRYTCLTNVDVAGLNLRDVDFAKANLSHAAFVETDLRGARFDYANLDGTQFAEVNLAASSLCYADFSHVDFRSGTILTDALVDTSTVESLAGGATDVSRTSPCP
ncbi:pentapeptide repeat-containing protein [Actinophytocola sp.]|uniref:pentapeptide repeat-containing protein n=1 Tax=Actinophytocola sp. TaxID=1872138 RepID=UPI002ED10AB8